MSGWFQSMGNAWEQYIWQPILDFNFWDALDILLLTAFLYGVYVFLKGRRAGTLAVGLILILAFYVISDLAGLRAIHELMRGIVAPSAIIILAIVFQPELRDALEKLGSTPRGLFSTAKGNRADLAHTVGEVVDAAFQIAQSEKDGALIVIERSTPLGDYAAKGHLVDAHVSAGLLRNIFVDRSPLHDGAVIIRNNRIAAAGSKLPLSSNEGVVRGMGTRHRAASWSWSRKSGTPFRSPATVSSSATTSAAPMTCRTRTACARRKTNCATTSFCCSSALNTAKPPVPASAVV